MNVQPTANFYDAYIMYSHLDLFWVQKIISELENEYNVRIWSDKWIVKKDKYCEQALLCNLENIDCSIVCIGEHTPIAWAKDNLLRVTDIRIQRPSFRILVSVLPNAHVINELNDELDYGNCVDFSKGLNSNGFLTLAAGVKGVVPGFKPPVKNRNRNLYSKERIMLDFSQYEIVEDERKRDILFDLFKKR